VVGASMQPPSRRDTAGRPAHDSLRHIVAVISGPLNYLSEAGAGQDARAGIDGTCARRRRADRSQRAGTSPQAKAPRPTWSDNVIAR